MRRRPLLLAMVMASTLLPLSLGASAQEGLTLRVAADGSADYDSINAALEAAAAGDTVLIGPGEYDENLYLDKPVTLRGDGPREDIVILHDESDPQVMDMVPDGPSVITIYVDDVDVTIEHLSIMDEDDSYVSIVLKGGETTIRDVHANDFIGVRGDAVAVIEDSYVERLGTLGPNHTTATGLVISDLFIASDGSSGRLEGSVVRNLPIVIETGASFEIIGNTITPLPDEPGILVFDPQTSATIIDNEIAGGRPGIAAEHIASAHIEGNTILDPWFGIITTETEALVRGNTISGAEEAGILVSGNGISAEGNTITGGRMGILVSTPNGYPPGAPRFDEPARVIDNTIVDASHFGLVINDASPIVSGNSICAGREAISIKGDSDPQLGTNEICEVSGE